MPAHSGDPVTAALCQSLSDSCVRIDSIDEKLSVSSTRVLLGHINYEPAGSFESNVLGNLKSKYIVLKNDVQLKKNVSVMSAASSSSSDAKKEDSTLPVPKVTLYPPDRVRPGWSGTYPVGAGMINIGNTCYLNSTLQALFHVPSLVNWLESDSDHLNGCFVSNGSIESECIICAMSKCLKMAQNKSGGVMKPFYIYNKLKSICKHMVHGQQEDAHEFLRYLVESMEKAYLSRYKNVKLDNYSKETTPLNQIFGGYIRTEVNCLQCHGVSTTFQHFQDILLDIRRSSTLDDALSGYFCKERLDGEDAYRCERCHKKVSATKKFSIERPPMVLCIQLKRFSILGGKINKHVSFSQRLDLTRFLCPHSTQVSQKPLVYRLVAMVTHVGSSVHCGHYTAVAQTSSGQFYHFDDSSVRPISLHSALETNAYIIIYEMERNPFKAQSTGAGSTSKPATVTSSAVASHMGGHSSNVFKTDSLRQNVPSTVEANNKFGTTTFPVVNGSARSPTKTTSRENSFTSSSSHSNSTGVPVDRKMGLLPPLKDRYNEDEKISDENEAENVRLLNENRDRSPSHDHTYSRTLGRVTFGLRPQHFTPDKNGSVCHPPASLVPYESDDSSSGDSETESAKNERMSLSPGKKKDVDSSFPLLGKKEKKNIDSSSKKDVSLDVAVVNSNPIVSDSLKSNSVKTLDSKTIGIDTRIASSLRVNTAPSPVRSKATSAGWQVTEVSLHSPSVHSGSSNNSVASSTTEWTVTCQKRTNTTPPKKMVKSSIEEARKTTSEASGNSRIISNGTQYSSKNCLPQADRNFKLVVNGTKIIPKVSNERKEINKLDENPLKVSPLVSIPHEKKLDLDLSLDVAVVSTDGRSEEKTKTHKEFVNGKNFHTDAVNGKQYNNRVPETNGEHHWNGSCRSDVADRLHSLSQGTYGADVNTWNGTRNHDDRNEGEDYRESRKREFDRQYDEEFDRGRVKKMKFHDDRDPDYRPKSNVFQDFQRRNNNYRQNRYNKNFIRNNKFFNRNNNRNFRHNNQFRYHRGNGGTNNYHHNNGPNKAPPVACGPRYGSYNNW